MWRHPDMTAAELAEILPGRTAEAVRSKRAEVGRWRTAGVVPMCQRCGLHPVHVQDRDARRWGLCQACAIDEKEWRDRHAAELRRRNDARRQRRHRGGA